MFSVTLNNKIIHEYTDESRLPGHVRLFLDEMDSDMQQGIKIDGVLAVNPAMELRLDYVVFKLKQGLDECNNGLILSTSAYIANRHPGISGIHIVQRDGEKMISIDYVQDRE